MGVLALALILMFFNMPPDLVLVGACEALPS
jgi:hypothetical protein